MKKETKKFILLLLPLFLYSITTCNGQPCADDPGLIANPADPDMLTCIDIDECDNAPCMGGGTCHNTYGSFECHCDFGCALNADMVTCQDVDECSDDTLNDCDHVCTNAPCGDGGRYTCTCNAGYTLGADGHSCIDIDECETSPCLGGGTCRNTIGSFECSCDIGCELNADMLTCDDVNECNNVTLNDCDHVCTNAPCGDGGRYTCTCNAGYTLGADGHSCIDNNECEDGSNGGCQQVCSNEIGSYTCNCYDGCGLNIDGLGCTDINECTDGSHNCDQNCINLDCTSGLYNCTCDTGYMLANDRHTCLDVSECEDGLDNCEQVCINTLGSYTCECQPGCTLNTDDATCTDINECLRDDHGCNHICNNQHCTQGRYNCSCFIGYYLGSDESTCLDINECSQDIDQCEQECYNNVGSYTCGCYDGCLLNNTDGYNCYDVDECLTGVCEQECDNHHCTDGRYTCSCRSGYVLNENNHTCNDINECLVNNGGCEHICTNTVGSYYCTCRLGYELMTDSYSCQALPCSTYLSAPINGHTNCTDVQEQVTDSICSFGCNSGYELVGPPYRTCTDTSVWTGLESTCIKQMCPSLIPMSGYLIGRPCTYEYESVCVIYCPDGYTLNNGEVSYVQECVANNNGGVEWTANKTCYKSTGECTPNPCHNNGQCYVQQEGPICACPSYTTGAYCEQLILSTPLLPILSVGIQSTDLIIQLPITLDTPVSIIISTSVTPTITLTIPPNTLSVSYTLTPTLAGIYTIHYIVLGEVSFASIEEQYLTVTDQSSTSNYFERNNLTLGQLSPTGCCSVNISQSFCPSQILTLSSSTCSYSSQDNIVTKDITFIHSGSDINLPVSIIGAWFNPHTLSLTPSMNSMDTNCPTSHDNDVQSIVRYNSLIRTFYKSITDTILPSQLTLAQIGDITGNTYEMYNYISSIVTRRHVPTITGCENIPHSNKDTPTLVIRSNTFLNATINNRFITYKDSSQPPVCYAIELCQLPQSVLDISLPKRLGELISSLIISESFLPNEWHAEITSVHISSYGLNDNNGNINYWDGNVWRLISHSPHSIGLTGTVSSDTISNGYLSMTVEVNGIFNMSPVSRDVPVGVYGRSTLSIGTSVEFTETYLLLTSDTSSGLFINNNTQLYNKSLSISVNYDPSNNQNFFSNLFVTHDGSICPLNSYVQLTNGFDPLVVSLYSTCIGLYIHGMSTFGLTSRTIFPSSSSHWSDYPNTTLLVTAYNDETTPIHLGPFITLRNYDNSGCYIMMRVDQSGAITGMIYKATINIYGTLVEVDIPITSGDMMFTAVTKLFGTYDVIINGRITPSDSWDTARVNVDIEFPTSSSSFLTICDTLYQTINDISNFTNTRLSDTDLDLSTVTNSVNNLQSSVNWLQDIYDDSVNQYTSVEQEYDDILQQKDELINTFESAHNISVGGCTPCTLMCQFASINSICNNDAILPVTQILRNMTGVNETVRYSINHMIQECRNEMSCPHIRGVKWLIDSLLLTPNTYDGVTCNDVCTTYTTNKLVYTDVERESNKERYYSSISSFTSQRSYTCSQSVNDSTCTYHILPQPCQTIYEQCNQMRRTQVIAQVNNNVLLQELNTNNIQYMSLVINEGTVRADLYTKRQRMELYRQQLLITRQALTNSLTIQQVIQNTQNWLPNALTDQINIRDILINRLNAGNIAQLLSLNFTADLEQSSSDTVSIVIVYELLSQSQNHVLTRQVNMNQPLDFVSRYLSHEIITHILSVSNRRKRNVPIDSLPLVEGNCFLLQEFNNYLWTINTSLVSAWNETQEAITSIEWQSNQLQVQYNDIVTASNNLANSSVLIDRETRYLNEGQYLLNETRNTVSNTSIISWLKPIQDYHNTTIQLGGISCYSFIDCLNMISYTLFTSLSDSRDSISTIQHVIRTLATSKHATISDTLSWISHMTYLVNNETQYWCSTLPNFNTQTPPIIPLETGTNTSITCPPMTTPTTTPTPLPVTYNWIKNNYTLPNITSNTLSIIDDGYYQCQVTTDTQSVRSLASHVFHYQLPVITDYTRKVWTYTGNQEGVALQCTATGSPSWSWWYTPDGIQAPIQLIGQTSNILFINTPTHSNTGWYYCNATTPYGTAHVPIQLLVLQHTIAINRYRFQLTISGGEGTVNDLKETISETLDWLNITSIHDLTVTMETGYYSVWFYVSTVNISTLDQSIDNITGQYTIERWRLQEYVQTIREHFNDLTLGQYDINSFSVGDREYICPIGNQLHSNYIFCVPCPTGYYGNGSSTIYRYNIPEVVPQCGACPVGQYSSLIGTTGCTSCSLLYSTESEGSTDNTQCIGLCTPHYYSSNGLWPCTSCPPNYYQPSYGSTKCIDCATLPDINSVLQCQEVSSTSPPVTYDNSPNYGVIIGSTVVIVLAVLIFCLSLIIILVVVTRQKDKKDTPTTTPKTKTFLTRIGKFDSVKTKKGGKSKYINNPLYVSGKKGEKQEMTILNSSSMPSIMKTEATNIDDHDLSDIEKDIEELEQQEDTVPLIQATPTREETVISIDDMYQDMPGEDMPGEGDEYPDIDNGLSTVLEEDEATPTSARKDELDDIPPPMEDDYYYDDAISQDDLIIPPPPPPINEEPLLLPEPIPEVPLPLIDIHTGEETGEEDIKEETIQQKEFIAETIQQIIKDAIIQQQDSAHQETIQEEEKHVTVQFDLQQEYILPPPVEPPLSDSEEEDIPPPVEPPLSDSEEDIPPPAVPTVEPPLSDSEEEDIPPPTIPTVEPPLSNSEEEEDIRETLIDELPESYSYDIESMEESAAAALAKKRKSLPLSKMDPSDPKWESSSLPLLDVDNFDNVAFTSASFSNIEKKQ